MCIRDRNKLLSLSPAERAQGVIAASAGNHAQGVAYHAGKLGIRAQICMPLTTPLIKVSATRGYGADVILHGANYDEAYEESLRRSQAEHLTFVHAFDDDAVIAGQGTIGLEPVSYTHLDVYKRQAYDHARTQFEKEQKQQPRQSTGRASTKSNVRSASGSSLRVLEDGKLRRSHLRNVFLGVARDAFERLLQLPVKLAHRRIVRTGGNSNLCAHAHQRL